MANTEINQYKGVWCYGEVRHGKLTPTLFELLEVGGKLAKELGEKLSVVLVGHELDKWTKDIFESGAETIYLLDNPGLANFVDDVYVKVLADLIAKEKPNKFLLPASIIGKSITGRLAAVLNTGASADATELAIGSGKNSETKNALHVTRPTYGGNVIATILCENHRPEISTVKPMVFARAQKIPGKTGEVIKVTVNPAEIPSKTKFVNFNPEETAELDIASADKVISGGRGLGNAEGFKVIRDFAHTLGAAVGASRAAVDAGWIPYRHQVGLTGRSVRPKLYIACGISGQVQHLAGMGQSETIVAINKDPDCPMMKLANFSIEADLYEFIPLAIAELKKHKN